MTIDGLSFEAYKKKDQLKFVDWFASFAENAAQEKGGRGIGEYREVEDEARVKAHINEVTTKKGDKTWRRKTNRTYKKRYTNFAARKKNLAKLPNTIDITPEHVPVLDINQNAFQAHKMHIEMEDTPTTKKYYGLPYRINTGLLNASDKKPIPLNEARILNEEKESVLEDILGKEEVVMRKVLSEFSTQHPGRKIIITSDTTLAWLMTANHTENPWHLFAKIIHTNNSNFIVLGNIDDVQWVAERNANRPSDDDKTPAAERTSSLGEESTKVYQSFKVNICSDSRAQIKTEKNPFPNCHQRLYRYRIFTIKDSVNGDYSVVVRCQI
ncbi:translation initiation factor 3 subunit D [Angomonas deanei]|nr:translation initiation factor 3 subunit D [Angomonas deanei]|eukprot:EPY28395.1 translation initiation factor 3 subunit D [Angomonas deanei]